MLKIKNEHRFYINKKLFIQKFNRICWELGYLKKRRKERIEELIIILENKEWSFKISNKLRKKLKK